LQYRLHLGGLSLRRTSFYVVSSRYTESAASNRRRVDGATRASLAFLARLFDWRDALIVVRPDTLIRWHRAGWRLFWRRKSTPGRSPIPLELRQLIRRMATENPLWGEERIANELLLKLGLRVSPRTVRKYMPSLQPRSRSIMVRSTPTTRSTIWR
jgi:hypothetical protein